MNLPRLRSLPWKPIGVLALAGYFLYVAFTLRRNIYLPFLIDLGIGQVRVYAACVFAAVIAGIAYFAYVKRKEKSLQNLDLWDLSLWIIVPGLIAARLLHVIEYWEVYSRDLTLIVAFWVGGLSVLGGMLGGLLGAYIYTRRSKLEWLTVLRHLVLVWPILHFIGRAGNYFDRALYGLPTNLPWGMYIEPGFRSVDFVSSQFYHPVFLYEQILNLGIFVLLWRMNKRNKSTMTLVKTYTFFYLTGRFLLDFFRLEPRTIPGLTFTQLVILSLFFVAIVFGVAWQVRWRHKYGEWWTKVSK